MNEDKKYIVQVVFVRNIKVTATDDIQAEIEAWKKMTAKARQETIGLRAFPRLDLILKPPAQFLRDLRGQNDQEGYICSPDHDWLNSNL